MKKGDDDSLPDWPQVYEKLIEVRTSGVDVPIECKAFAFTKMLGNQTTKIKTTLSYSGFSISPSHPPHPTNPAYFMTAANTCIWIAFRGDCLAFSIYFYCFFIVI
jgi:hypothetical protein